MQHLFKFDIQAAIKCAQKIDQRQIPSDGARWGEFYYLIWNEQMCRLKVLIVMFYLYWYSAVDCLAD